MFIAGYCLNVSFKADVEGRFEALNLLEDKANTLIDIMRRGTGSVESRIVGKEPALCHKDTVDLYDTRKNQPCVTKTPWTYMTPERTSPVSQRHRGPT